MAKQPIAENLFVLMEWLRLGKLFHIHKEFLLYLDITDIARLCFTSKISFDKYFRFSCLHYIGVNNNLLSQLRMATFRKQMTRLEVLKEGEGMIHLTGQVNGARRVGTLRKMYEHNKKFKRTIHSVLTQI